SEPALAMVARLADGWEASYLPPGEFAERWQRLRRLLAAERRDPESVRRSVEVDVVLGRSPADAANALGLFCTARGIDSHHALAATAPAGDATAVEKAARAYEAAGVTDLLLGFADFPATGMLEVFAAAVAPALRHETAVPRPVAR